mmetsp:Transcript_49358/g.105020  ORF Transcript_49358/g.105020 Transcript_49358/m.105020 type:complete len:375 (+) Transcript_49358:82-1206(+)
MGSNEVDAAAVSGKPPRIALLGIGGVGGWLAARLIEAGKDVAEVVLIARGEHGAAIWEKGLQLDIEHPDGNTETIRTKPGDAEVYTSIAEAVKQGSKPVDYIILGVKTWQVAETSAQCRPYLTPGGCVVTTQNGIEAPHKAAEGLDFASVLASAIHVFAWIQKPGVVSMKAAPAKFAYGEVFTEDGRELGEEVTKTPRCQRLFDTFEKCKGVKPEIAPHGAWGMLWDKAMLMSSTGPVGALARAPLDQTTSIPETRTLLKSVLLEVAQCCAAKGHLTQGRSPEQAVEEILALVTSHGKTNPGVTQSLLRDMVCGRPSEVNELSGGIIRAGQAVGVPTPLQNFITAALLPQELRARGESSYVLMGVPGGAPHVQV